MMMKFQMEDAIEGSGGQEDTPERSDQDFEQPDFITTNRWYKENCRGIPRPTAFLAERGIFKSCYKRKFVSRYIIYHYQYCVR